jgi:ankyrin repeat protein
MYVCIYIPRGAIERRLQIVQEAALKPSANYSALPSTIHRAASTGQLNAVIIYIKQLGCTPNEYDSSGIGPIHYAAEKGFIKYVLKFSQIFLSYLVVTL